MEIETRVEARRGCGWRKPGGLYLVADGIGDPCPLLPVPLVVCPACGCGIKPARGWTWIEPDTLLNPREHGHSDCPLNEPGGMGERAGLLWIGGVFYTPQEWVLEAHRMGVSRRIQAVPRGFVLGETWVAVAHRAVPAPDPWSSVTCPGVFYLFRPQRIEYVVRGDESDDELDALLERGITPLRVERAEQQSLLEV
jgi:hypothetical protein